MNYYLFLTNLISNYGSFFLWRDLLEVACFSITIYYTSLWLRSDTSKPLLLTFYAYCSGILISHALQLTTVYHTLLYGAPVTMLLFIIMHQRTLQKNFITLRNQKITTQPQDWIKVMVRYCLQAAQHKRTVHWIIEQNDNLQTLLSATLSLHAPLSDNLLTIIADSPSIEETTVLWATSRGILRGINTSWNSVLGERILHAADNKQEDFVHTALFFTEKTDAIILCTQKEGLFTLVANGKVFRDVSAYNTITYLRKQCLTATSTSDKKGKSYERARNNHKQHSA